MIFALPNNTFKNSIDESTENTISEILCNLDYHEESMDEFDQTISALCSLSNNFELGMIDEECEDNCEELHEEMEEWILCYLARKTSNKEIEYTIRRTIGEDEMALFKIELKKEDEHLYIDYQMRTYYLPSSHFIESYDYLISEFCM